MSIHDVQQPVLSDELSVAENNLTDISTLEEKLHTVQAERDAILHQLQCTVDEQNRHQNALLSRLINADYLLAQSESLLPIKRPVTTKPPTNLAQQIDSHPDIYRPLLEPVCNLIHSKLYSTMKDVQLRVQQSNDDLIAWKFNPESTNGKRLMSRVRQLLNENELLGRVNHNDRVSMLQAETDAQTKCLKEFATTHEDIGSVLQEADADLECLQSNLLAVHQQINEAESVVELLQAELEAVAPECIEELVQTAWNNVNQMNGTEPQQQHQRDPEGSTQEAGSVPPAKRKRVESDQSNPLSQTMESDLDDNS